MGIRAVIWALERAPCPTSTARLTLAVIAGFANEADLAFPSHATVQARVGCTWRTFQKALADLIGAQCLIDTGERKGRQHNVHVYRVLVPDTFKLGCKAPKHRAASDRDELQSTSARLPRDDEQRSSTCFLAGRPPAGWQEEPVTKPKTPRTAKAVLPPKRPRRSARGGRISPSWEPPTLSQLPSDLAEQFMAWPSSRYSEQGLAFRDYWLAEGGARASKYDWERAWFAWLRRHIERQPSSLAPPVRSQPGPKVTVAVLEDSRAVPADLRQEGELPIRLERALRVRSKSHLKWLDNAVINFLDSRADHWGIEIIVSPADRTAVETSEPFVLAVARSIGLSIDWMRVGVQFNRRVLGHRPQAFQAPPTGGLGVTGAKKAGTIF